MNLLHEPALLAITCIALLGAWTLGFYTRRIYGLCSKIYWHRKLKICWRYKATGRRENRDGTVSDFCQRCGHPYGYHQ